MLAKRDEHLVRMCLLGDQQAFAELVDRYQKSIFNLALRMTNRRADAEDVTQTTFIKAYENLVSFKPYHHFFSWLYRIGINEAINCLRNRNRFVPLPDQSALQVSQSEKTSVDTETSELVQEALMHLNRQYRLLLVLRHLHELHCEDIAYMLNTSVHLVKVRLVTARHLLKNILIKMGIKNEKN